MFHSLPEHITGKKPEPTHFITHDTWYQKIRKSIKWFWSSIVEAWSVIDNISSEGEENERN
jgi:hypothetical protein